MIYSLADRGPESLKRFLEAQQRLRRRRESHRKMIEVVRAYQGWLQSGMYVITPKVAYKKGSGGIAHLLLYRGAARGNNVIKDAAWRVALIGVNRFRVKGSGGRATALTTMADKPKWDVVLLAPEMGRVYRFSPSIAFTSKYIDTREKIRCYLPTPSYDVIENGRGLVEEYIWGVGLKHASPEVAVNAVKELLGRIRYGCLLFAGAVENTQAERYLAWVSEPEFKAFCMERGADDRLVAEILGAPRIPSQNDLEPKNIILTPSGPVVIDLAAPNIAWTPFWYDAFRLILTHDPRGYWRGVYDEALEGIFRACKAINIRFCGIRYEVAAAYALIHPENRLADPSYIRGDVKRDIGYAMAAWDRITSIDEKPKNL